MICRLNSTVRIPIATSTKKEEKPVTVISRGFRPSPSGRAERGVFFRLKKWVRVTAKDTAEPMAVAGPEPKMPMPQVNTKKQSLKMLNTPPASTPAAVKPRPALFTGVLLTHAKTAPRRGAVL